MNRCKISIAGRAREAQQTGDHEPLRMSAADRDAGNAAANHNTAHVERDNGNYAERVQLIITAAPCDAKSWREVPSRERRAAKGERRGVPFQIGSQSSTAVQPCSAGRRRHCQCSRGSDVISCMHARPQLNGDSAMFRRRVAREVVSVMCCS